MRKWLVAALGLLAFPQQPAWAGELDGCDDRLKAVTANDPDARVILVKPFAKGERLALPGVSPDRADAMVWALTELLLGKGRAEPRVRVL